LLINSLTNLKDIAAIKNTNNENRSTPPIKNGSAIVLSKKTAILLGRKYLSDKQRGKCIRFAIHERQSLTVVEHYLIVLTAYALFPDWKIVAEFGAVLQICRA